MNDKVNIVFFGSFSFPHGDAAGARILELAKGAIMLDQKVTVISLYGKRNVKGWHSYKESRLKYVSTGVSKALGSSFIQRIRSRIHFFKSKRQLLRNLVESLEGQSNNLIYFYGRSYYYLKSVVSIINKLNIETSICIDIVEPAISNQSFMNYIIHPFSIDAKLSFSPKILSKLDLAVFISNNLKLDYESFFNNNLVIPSVVAEVPKMTDLQFTKLSSDTCKTIRIGYLGALLKKDDPDRLIKFCNLLFNQNIKFELNILGRSNNFKEGRNWRSVLNSCVFSDKIKYHDNLERKKVQEVMRSMDFNILLRFKDDLQLKTFPTRIIDLLIAERPVITNLFGDLNEYFSHGVNCIDIEEIELNKFELNKIFDISYQRELLLGGNKLLESCFNSKVQMQNLIKNLQKNKKPNMNK